VHSTSFRQHADQIGVVRNVEELSLAGGLAEGDETPVLQSPISKLRDDLPVTFVAR